MGRNLRDGSVVHAGSVEDAGVESRRRDEGLQPLSVVAAHSVPRVRELQLVALELAFAERAARCTPTARHMRTPRKNMRGPGTGQLGCSVRIC